MVPVVGSIANAGRLAACPPIKCHRLVDWPVMLRTMT